jgi:hypothetical protein
MFTLRVKLNWWHYHVKATPPPPLYSQFMMLYNTRYTEFMSKLSVFGMLDILGFYLHMYYKNSDRQFYPREITLTKLLNQYRLEKGEKSSWQQFTENQCSLLLATCSGNGFYLFHYFIRWQKFYIKDSTILAMLDYAFICPQPIFFALEIEL